jgi:hypothetical protein
MTELTKGMTYQITATGLLHPLAAEKAQRRGEVVPYDPPDEGEVSLCRQWLERFAKPRKTVNPVSSYFLKHCVEAYFGEYVSNGAFIEAVRRLGWEIVPLGWYSPNAAFRLSYDKEAVRKCHP